MATMEEKMSALTRLMQEGILTAEEFANVVAAMNGGTGTVVPVKEKSELEKQYDAVFSNHIINAFKSPASCKWPELTLDMVKKGEIKISGTLTRCTYTCSKWSLIRKSFRCILAYHRKHYRCYFHVSHLLIRLRSI